MKFRVHEAIHLDSPVLSLLCSSLAHMDRVAENGRAMANMATSYFGGFVYVRVQALHRRKPCPSDCKQPPGYRIVTTKP